MPALPGTHYSWIGWSNVRKFLAQRNATTGVASHSPIIQLGRLEQHDVGKVLAQGNNNNKQHHLGIEPGSSVHSVYSVQTVCSPVSTKLAVHAYMHAVSTEPRVSTLSTVSTDYSV